MAPSNPVIKAEKALIKAQKEAQRAYKCVQKAQDAYARAKAKAAESSKKSTKLKSKMIKLKTKSKSKTTKPKTKSTKAKTTKTKSTKAKTTKTKSTKAKKMRGGGGSDWLNTVNSRGNVAAPDDHWGVPGSVWSAQFQKSGEYIPLSTLRKGSVALQSNPKVQVPGGNYRDSLMFQTISSNNNNNDLPTQRI